MNDDIVLKEIKICDLNEKYQTVVKIIGMDNFIALIKRLGGSQFYIPKMFMFTKEHIYKKFLQEYDGKNLRVLVTKYDISDSTAYRLIKNNLSGCKGQIKKQ